MVVSLTKNHVARILAFASAILPRKTSIPALACALFEPDGPDRVRVSLGDLEQTLTMSLEPERRAGNPEAFLFPVAELRNLKSDTVTLQPVAEDAVVCTSLAGDRSFARTIPVPPASGFPPIPVLPGELADCDPGAFLRAYRGTSFAAAKDTSRLALGGVYADSGESALVATDGHRLTRRILPDFPLSGSAILPLNKVLLRQFPETDAGRIGLFENDNGTQCLALAAENLAYVCQCRDATYPNYRQVIPENTGNSAGLTFGGKDLETVESVVPCLDKANRNGLFLFGRADGTVLLGIEGKDGGDPVVLPLPECRCENGDGLVLAMDGLLFAEALQHGFQELRACFGHSPLVFGDGETGTHILMPLKGDPSDTLLRAAGVPIPPRPAEPETGEFPAQPADAEPHSAPEPKSEPVVPVPPAASKPHGFANRETTANEDPVARLEELACETLETVQTALANVREFKRQVRSAKSHFRAREKEIESREREMEKSRSLIQRLQEAIAA